MLKRILSLLMAICITMTLFPVVVVSADDSAAAAEEITLTADASTDAQPVIHYVEPITLVNPLDGGAYAFDIVPDESDTIVQPVDEATYVSEEKASRTICNSMEARDTSFTVYVKTKKNYQSCFDAIWKGAFAHTGVPTEGDALLWCWNSCSAPGSYYVKNGYYYCTLNFKLTYKTTAAQEATLASRIDQLLEQLDLWENTDYQKVRGVYEYMCANIRYDYANLNDKTYKLKHTSYAALLHKTAVCSGYAWLFYQLMMELGVDCRCISGPTTPNGPVSEHAWNIVELNNLYYHLDSTWDEGIPPASYRYFLTSPSTFGQNHYRDVQYTVSSFTSAYPLDSRAYVPTTSSYLQITKQPAAQTLKAGSTASVSVTVKGESPSYRWYVTNASGSYTLMSTSRTCSFTMTESIGDRRVYCVVSDTAGRSVQTNVITLKMAPALKITSQPASASAPLGATVSTSVTAAGAGLTYKWYYRDPSSSSYKKSSVTSSVYSFEMTAAKSGRKVYCIVTDQFGDTVKSDVATLKKELSPKILQQPVSVEVPYGAMATATVVAQGDGLKYQWYVKNPGSSSYSKSSITDATYFVEMTAKKSGRKVYCVVSDQYGNKNKSEVATLTMEPTPKILQQPASVEVPCGEMATVTVVAQGNGLKYTWYYKNPGSSSYSKSSVTDATYFVEMTAAKSGRKVYCVVSDQHGNKNKSEVATLTMEPTPKILQQPASVEVPYGEMATATVVAQGDGLKYQWYVKNPGSSSYSKSSITDATYFVEMTAAKSGRKVYCVVSDQYGNKNKSSVATLTMEPTPRILQQPSDVTVSVGEIAQTSVVAQGDGLKYQWYVKSPGKTSYSKSSLTGPTYYVEMTAKISGRKIYCVISDQYGNKNKTDVVTLYAD